MADCIRCGKKSENDVCSECLKEMEHLNVREKIYDLRYSKYSVDHGEVETDILSGFVTEDKRVLEIGCGAGHLSYFLYGQGMNVIAIDFSKYMVQTAKKSYPGLNFMVMSAEQLGLKEESFDMVVSYELIEHLYDIKSHLGEVRRILKPGGLYIIKTPSKRIDSVYSIFNRSTKGYRKAFHPSQQSHSSLRKLLGDSGFDVKFLSIRELSETQRAWMKNKGLKIIASSLINPFRRDTYLRFSVL